MLLCLCVNTDISIERTGRKIKTHTHNRIAPRPMMMMMNWKLLFYDLFTWSLFQWIVLVWFTSQTALPIDKLIKNGRHRRLGKRSSASQYTIYKRPSVTRNRHQIHPARSLCGEFGVTGRLFRLSERSQMNDNTILAEIDTPTLSISLCVTIHQLTRVMVQ